MRIHYPGLAGLVLGASAMVSGCDSSDAVVTPPAPLADITVTGSVFDGPVFGGQLFVFAAADINAAIASAAESADRAAALASAAPLVSLLRDPNSGGDYSLAVPGTLAGEALFFVFDAAGASDAAFGGQPFNMESVGIATEAGSQMRVNLTPHTTAVAITVRHALDPDGDGTPVDATAIGGEIELSTVSVRSALGTSALGDELFPGGEDPLSSDDSGVLEPASLELGLTVRTIAALSETTYDEAMFLLAADAADGVIDGEASAQFDLDPGQNAALGMAAAAHGLGREQPGDVAVVSCTGSAASLRRACAFEVLDDFFLGLAACAHEGTSADAETCRETAGDERDEGFLECGAVTAARLQLCTTLADAPHDPAFGADFASSFVDPLEIGGSVPANPYLPLKQGTEWVYEGTFEEDGEMITEVITITVTDRIKLVDGVPCLVVRDVVTIDGELVEDTDDWLAQDVSGNIWYCGEEAKDYEVFDGDSPPLPELVAIDGSFKSGRDGDEAGILLPAVPVVGDVFRQEVSFANAEDVIEILATDGTEVVPAAACVANCLVTRDFTPLEPEGEENKYYARGVGKILEIDVETGDRVELVSVTMSP